MAVIELGRQDEGRTVRVTPGDRIDVRLPETPTTGYRWLAADPPGVAVRYLGETVEPAAGSPGAPGARAFHYEAGRPGRAKVVLLRRRPWESERAALDRFTVTLEVAPA